MAERQTEQHRRTNATENGPQATRTGGGTSDEQAMTRTAQHERPQTSSLDRYGDARYGRALSPFTWMRRMMEDMDRMYDELGFGGGALRSGAGLEPWRSWAGSARGDLWHPQIEVAERDGKLLVKADLPGMSKDDVRIEVADDMLTISGERRQERREERGGRDYTERSYGSFTRSIALPPGVNGQECEASFDHGVLEVTVPLPRPTKRAHTLEIRPRDAGSASGPGKAADRTRPS